jgi:phospholipase C
MSYKSVASKSVNYLRIGLTSLALFQFTLGGPLASSAQAQEGNSAKAPTSNDGNTVTPIKHVIVIIGENRSFDHVYATYKPAGGEKINNLLSEGIVNADGTPGPNFSLGTTYSAVDKKPDPFLLSPGSKSVYPVLPTPLTAGAPMDPYVPTISEAHKVETALPGDYYKFLTTGATGLPKYGPDTRINNVFNLPPGPFQLTDGMVYDTYSASPVHRFYQMWQQLDCSTTYSTESNPSGCKADLFPYVEITVGAGTNGVPVPKPFNEEITGEGSAAMGFYNVQQGDAPYMLQLAQQYTLDDNFHQSIMGGTGANHVALGTGDAIWFSDGNGNAAVPPENVQVYSGTLDQGTVNEIENPNPAPSSNNWYTEDGYGGGGYGSAVYGGGTYTNCSDIKQPGVAAVVTYLSQLPTEVTPNCDPGHYYLLNNYNPGYFGDGSNAYIDHFVYNTPFTIPPSSVRNIGDELLEANISWKYYGDQWNRYLKDKYQLNYGDFGTESDEYCNICNPFQYSTSIMTNAAVRTAHLQDTVNLYEDIAKGNLPAVSFVKPSGFVDGHPASSKLDLFEGFVKKIVDAVQANPTLWQDTAIFVTFDEGGGYYDSGYVQPLDFFGDGTRIPLLVISQYTQGGHVSHLYGDHVSLLKFIERNWSLGPITKRSRDNFPNPKVAGSNPYVPTNSPALSDLFEMFNFKASTAAAAIAGGGK